MKRRVWIVLAVVVVIAGATAAFLLKSDPPEEFPLLTHVPADAAAYAGFRDLGELDDLPRSLVAPLLDRIESSRPHLAGPVALYLDRELEWVFLALPTRTARLLGGAERVDGIFVSAQTPAALARHKAKTGSLGDRETFRSLGSRFFVDLESIGLPSRLNDFSAAGFDLDPGPPLALRGRALFRKGVFRLYLENYVHARPAGDPTGEAPVPMTLTEPPVRIWDEALEALDPESRELARREAGVLERTFLPKGQDLRDFLGRIGPTCGFSIVPTAHERPALIGWIELHDAETRKTLEAMLSRAAHDLVGHFRKRGEAPPVEVVRQGGLWRVQWWDPVALRLGKAWSPAYAFYENRLVFTTCAEVIGPPGRTDSRPHHAAATLEVPAILDALRALVPLLTDRQFRDDVARMADENYRKAYPPAALAELEKSVPDAFARARHLARERIKLRLMAHDDLSLTPGYRLSLLRWQDRIETLAARLADVDRIRLSGRFTGGGLELEVRAWPGE